MNNNDNHGRWDGNSMLREYICKVVQGFSICHYIVVLYGWQVDFLIEDRANFRTECWYMLPFCAKILAYALCKLILPLLTSSASTAWGEPDGALATSGP